MQIGIEYGCAGSDGMLNHLIRERRRGKEGAGGIVCSESVVKCRR